MTIEGRKLFGERVRCNVWVCGAGACVVLKTVTFDSRGENKGAYDLFYSSAT